MKRIILFAVSALIMTNASAETIKLKLGKVIEGEIIEKTDEYIKIDSGEQVFKIRFNMMDEQTIDLLKNTPVPLKDEQIEPNSNNALMVKSNKYISLGDSHYGQKNYEEAIENYRRAVEINPELDYAYQMMGRCSGLLMDFNNALLYAQKAAEINPKNVTAQVDIGYNYRALKRYDDSIREFKKAIQLDPNSYQAYKGLGDSYLFVEDPYNALEAYKKAVDIQPNFELLLEILKGLTALGEFQEALIYLEKAEAFEPSNPFILTAKGGVLTFLKRFDSAKEKFQKAMDIFKQNGDKEGINKVQGAMKALQQIEKEQR